MFEIIESLNLLILLYKSQSVATTFAWSFLISVFTIAASEEEESSNLLQERLFNFFFTWKLIYVFTIGFLLTLNIFLWNFTCSLAIHTHDAFLFLISASLAFSFFFRAGIREGFFRRWFKFRAIWLLFTTFWDWVRFLIRFGYYDFWSLLIGPWSDLTNRWKIKLSYIRLGALTFFIDVWFT